MLLEYICLIKGGSRQIRLHLQNAHVHKTSCVCSRFVLVPLLCINFTHTHSYSFACFAKKIYSRNTHLSTLEQVKYATCNIESVTLTSPIVDVAETQPVIQGQGDTQQQIVHTSSAKPKSDQKEKQDDAPVEATSLSAGVLHQLIEDLEDKAVPVCAKDSSSNTTSKEHVAIWEEKEEKLIRTIEDNANEIGTKTFRESGSIGHFRATELKHDDELRSRSTQHLSTTSKETSLEEIQLEKHESSSLSSLKPLDATMTIEQILPTSDMEKRKLDETTKKKKGFGSRLRRFFRAAFGRRKN